MGSFVGGDASSTTGNSTTVAGVTWPATDAGDLAILIWTASNTQTFGTPTGFTSFDSDDDSSCRTTVWTRVCDGAESGDVAAMTLNPGGTRQSAVLYVVRGYTGINAAAHTARGTTTTSNECPSVTPTVADAGIIVTCTERLSTGTTTATAPTGFANDKVEFGTSGAGGTFNAVAHDGLNVSRAADVAVDPGAWTGLTSGSDGLARTIALTPAAVAAKGKRARVVRQAVHRAATW